MIMKDGNVVVFIYEDKEYILDDYPFEPCMYIIKEGQTCCTLHNAFMVYQVLKSFTEGKTVTAINGIVYDEKRFCNVLAAAIKSGRRDMEFADAAELVDELIGS